MVTAQEQPAVSLTEESTLDLTQATTTIHCQQATLPAVTVASASRWRSAGELAINTPAEIVLQLEGGHFEHHGPLSLNGEPNLAIEGKEHTKGQGRVLALTNGSRVSLKVDHPLTVNSILLAAEGDEAGSQVTMESPQLSVNGVIDLSHTDGGSLNLKGTGTLQLAELICSPGSRFRVSGDYTVHIGKVSFQLDSVTSQPAQLAFHLSQGNRLQIGQFNFPERQPGSPAPLSLEIEGQGLQVSLDLQKQRAACFPAGTHYTYQAANQAAPIQLIAQLPQGKLEYPSSAQLAQMMASDSCLDPQPTQRFWYTSEGQSCPIAVALDPNSAIIAPTAAQFSHHPPLI